jgi:hypothetical protein
MGNNVGCACIEQALTGSDSAARVRIELLQKGNKFMRSALLGLTSKEMFVKLSDDTSFLEWKSSGGTFTAAEHGEVDLTIIKCIKLSGAQGMQFIGADDEKVVFDIQAEDDKIRDQWVVNLNDLLQDWASNPSRKPKYNSRAAGTSNKNEYFKRRQEEIEAKERENAEKKKKYATGGMKYTAQAMMNRA